MNNAIATKSKPSLRQLFDNRKELGLIITKAAGAYRLNPLDFIIQEGYNTRDYSAPDVVEYIDNLVEAIRRGEDLGLFKVEVLEDKSIAVREGHCRTIAHRKAHALGIEFNPVLVEEVGSSKTIILTSSLGLKLKPLERAKTYIDILTEGYDIKYIATIEGITEVAVRNLIKAYNLPEDVKKHINAGIISVTNALELSKEYRDGLGELIQAKINEAQVLASLEVKEEQIDIFEVIHEDKQPGTDSWDVLEGMQDGGTEQAPISPTQESSTKLPEIQKASESTNVVQIPISKAKSIPEIPLNQQVAPTKPTPTKTVPLRITAKSFGNKTIKGDQAKVVIQILSTLAKKIEDAAASDQVDMDSIALSLDKEFAESIIRAAMKIKG